MGRKRFEIFANSWPDHADLWPNINYGTKYVMSGTMKKSGWKNSIFLKKLADIKKLKNLPTGKVLWFCGKPIKQERDKTMNKRTKTFFEQEVDRLTKEHGLPAHHYAYIRLSKAFMEKYYGDKIELNEIAAAACMSRFHYIRIFQQIYGMTPRQYLRDLRIKKAKELLAQGHSVTQACFDVGYESLPTFSKVFKRGAGYSPKAYQALNISNVE